MAEDEEKMKKMRCRMERDTYSVLLSFKEGANPRTLERRMDETLGYTYHNKYHEGGVHDMEELLQQHEKVRSIGNGMYKIIPTEEVRDLVELIKHQRDRNDERGGRDKRSRYGTTPRSRRLGTHGIFRSGLGGSLSFRQSKGFGGLRPITSVANHYPDGGSSGFKPLMSIPLTSSPYLTTSVPASQLPNYGQRPLTRPVVTPATFVPTAVAPPVSPPKAPKPPSSQPSIKEFSENSKKMMQKVQGSVHLSEMIDLYAKEFGVIVDPLQLFSKSWKMLVLTTFKDWLEMDSEGEVRLRGPGPVRNVPSRAASPATPADLAAIQGFRYQKTAVQAVLDRFEDLSLTARLPLPTPEKPPGIVNEPDCLISIMRPKSACSNLGERLRESPQPGEYDKTWLLNLRMVKKCDEMKKQISEALTEHTLKRGTRNPPFRPIPSRSNTKTNQYLQRVSVPEPKPDPYASLPKFGQRKLPVKSTPDIQAIVKPMEAQVAPAVEKLPEVKTEEILSPRMTAYYPPSVTRQQPMQLSEPTPEVKKEEPCKPYYPPSSTQTQPKQVPARLPSKLPPMSKGKGAQTIPRPVSAASSNTRRLNEAVVSELPYDDDFW